MSKKLPAEPAPRQEAVTATPGLYDKTDPIPVPDVIDGDQDSNWDLWQKALAAEDAKQPPTDNFDTTQPLPLTSLNGDAAKEA